MDLTTQQVETNDWNLDLSKWIIRNDVIYGSEIIRFHGEKRYSTARLKLFDVRTPEKLAASLHIANIRSFNVSEHNIYAVASRVMQWDKRFLLNPVRISTDLFYDGKTKASVGIIRTAAFTNVFLVHWLPVHRSNFHDSHWVRSDLGFDGFHLATSKPQQREAMRNEQWTFGRVSFKYYR